MEEAEMEVETTICKQKLYKEIALIEWAQFNDQTILMQDDYNKEFI